MSVCFGVVWGPWNKSGDGEVDTKEKKKMNTEKTSGADFLILSL